jgi:IS30 family transposase
MNTYKHLSFEERFVIEKLFNSKVVIREIAIFLQRSPNTISREIKRNKVKGVYCAEKAEKKASARRWRAKRQCLKVAMNSFLVQFVEAKLELKWTPKSISGYLKRELGINCSGKAIYKYVEHRGLEYQLFWKWNKKRGGPKRQKHAGIADNRKYIDQRPPFHNQLGHYELDFIVSQQSSYVLLVATDRRTTHSLVSQLPNRKRSTISQAFCEMFSGISVKSITTDNDIAFRHWPELETIIQAPIYFCHPYHSWEKGLVENTNRWIRCFVPKRRDIASVTKEDLDEIHTFLNDRPRECIGFRIPSVYYYEESSVLLEG